MSKVARVAGVVVALFVLGLAPGASRADDEEGGGGGGDEGGGGGGGGDEPAPAPAPDDDDKPTAVEPAGAADDDKPGDGDPPGGDDKADEPAPAAGGDADGDGTPDSAEDSDKDGVPDGKEDADGDGTPDVAEDTDGDGTPDGKEDADGDGTPDMLEDQGDGANDDGEAAGDPDDEDYEPPYIDADADGDGVVEPDEAQDQAELDALSKELGIPDEIEDDALDLRDPDADLKPSMTVDQFRSLVRLVKAKVLPRLEKKMAKKQAKRMKNFTFIVVGFSGLGVLLLFAPLALRRRYPGQGAMLLKYSALAALTWIVTVNLFGGVLYGMRSAQGALSGLTNPQLAIAGGVFDTLDTNAEDYIIVGKELFAPTLEQLKGNSDEQPAATLLANGQKIIGDGKVFLSMAKMFKSVDWLFAFLPIVLLGVTLLLFVLAIRPTLIEIIKLPTRVAAGDASAGRDVMRSSMRRVVGELWATVCTVAILTVLTLMSAFVLGQIVGPALDALLAYFSLSVTYLQFKDGASSGLVFCTLFGVIFFLVMNLATLILSMAFFLGKSQRIFQAKFNAGTPLANHKRFFAWGIPSVIFVQLFPLGFLVVAEKALAAINDKLMAGVTSAEAVNWKALLLAGPLFLVFAYIVVFWAARGVKAIRFLQAYRVKPKANPGSLGESRPAGA
jgi:hypothetical protein